MKALVKAKAEPGLWLEERPVPSVGPFDALVKVNKTGICGTDIHIYNWDEWAQRTIPVPLVVGHEYSGVIAELDDVAVRRRIGLLEMAELGLGEDLLLAGAEGQLDRLVAVALDGADGRHGARPGLEHGDALDLAVIEEPLGHPKLLGQDRGHGSRRPA